MTDAWLTGLCGVGWLKSWHTTELHLSLTQHLGHSPFLEPANRASISHITCPCHTLPTDCMMIGSIVSDCEMSGWYQQTVDVHCGLHRCCYLVLTMCWRQWHLCRSITDLWGAHHKQGCQGPGHQGSGHTGHYAMCWAGPVAAGRLCTFHNMLCSPALQ